MIQAARISVIVAARNEEEHLRETLMSMLHNTAYPNFQIIVVNDGSTDKTEEILGNLKLPKVQSIKTKGLGTARARNLGARFAKGEIFIFADAHIKVPPRWLENIVYYYKNYPFDILSVGIMADRRGLPGHYISYGQTMNEKAEAKWLREKPAFMAEVPLAAGGFTIYRREVFQSIGGYDQGFENWCHEDVEISIKAWLWGYSIRALPTFYITHIFRRQTPYKINMKEYFFNHYRTAVLHFNENRIAKVKKVLWEKLPKYGLNAEKSMTWIEERATVTKTWEQRQEYIQKRKYSDNWYFDHFKINF